MNLLILPFHMLSILQLSAQHLVCCGLSCQDRTQLLGPTYT